MFKTRKEMQSLIDVSRKNLANAEEEIWELRKENLELRKLRRQAEHNCTLALKQNTVMSQLLNEVADRAVQCPLESEKIVIQKNNRLNSQISDANQITELSPKIRKIPL